MLPVYCPHSLSCRVTGYNPPQRCDTSAWPKDPLVLHTLYSPAYHKLKRAARHSPAAAAYLRSAAGPKWMRKMSTIKLGLFVLLSAIGM